MHPYLSKKDLCSELQMSLPTIDKIVAGLKEQVISGRYSPYVIAGRRYNLYAVIDYLTYKDWLTDSKLKKKCPDFDPIAVARLYGQEGGIWTG